MTVRILLALCSSAALISCNSGGGSDRPPIYIPPTPPPPLPDPGTVRVTWQQALATSEYEIAYRRIDDPQWRHIFIGAGVGEYDLGELPEGQYELRMARTSMQNGLSSNYSDIERFNVP